MNRSLRDKGDFCWHCHSGIYSFPLHTAYQYEIPLILWNADGEGNAYFQLKEFPEIDLTLFNRFVNSELALMICLYVLAVRKRSIKICGSILSYLH